MKAIVKLFRVAREQTMGKVKLFKVWISWVRLFATCSTIGPCEHIDEGPENSSTCRHVEMLGTFMCQRWIQSRQSGYEFACIT